jgi:hypothetical protein
VGEASVDEGAVDEGAVDEGAVDVTFGGVGDPTGLVTETFFFAPPQPARSRLVSVTPARRRMVGLLTVMGVSC